MLRLNPELLPTLSIPQPKYARDQVKPGIVHLGIGAFHRAHQAVYTEEVMNEHGGDWGIIGCSLRSDAVKRQLEEQQGLYTVLERGSSNRPQIIGAVQRVLVGPENPAAIIAAMALPSVKIISLTITEKGYCHHPATGTLNYEHPDIQHDLGNPFSPISAPGFLVAGLRERCRRQLPPVTILSCDNLPDNGAVTRAVVTALAELIDPELAQWIKDKVTFPGTMVDRIVPATTADDISWLENQCGYQDQGLVMAEPFSQWVIEDHFCNDRPAWESAGALLVNDVGLYETMKLRLLNGSHSLLAYSGYLAGYATIYQVVQDTNFLELTRRFMALTGTTFSAPQNFDLAGYQEQLRERFANPGLQHKTWQIAMDGSQKIPQRWLNSLRNLVARNDDVQIFAFALAGWMRFISGTDENGDAIVVSDPMAATLMDISRRNEGDFAQQVREYFALERIFGADLKNNTHLWQHTAHWLERINARGVKGALEELLTVTPPHIDVAVRLV